MCVEDVQPILHVSPLKIVEGLTLKLLHLCGICSPHWALSGLRLHLALQRLDMPGCGMLMWVYQPLR